MGIADLETRIAEIAAERDSLRDALQDIADDPHCYAHEKSFTTDAEMSYAAGVVDGHRCAARTAREALNR
jgi:hypothetical protein